MERVCQEGAIRGRSALPSPLDFLDAIHDERELLARRAEKKPLRASRAR
ncbi:hypothetical protein JQN58_23410 [Aneurinibacillus sp. BA2021]|nr:hypothetical protein [Aneurinibacillus sp. BA2021]